MTKIRKFKVELRVKELARRAKRAKLDLAAAGLADETALRVFCGLLAASLEPAVVYQSFPAEHERAALAPVPGLGFSIGIATLGPKLEAFLESLSGQEAKLGLARLAQELALEDASAFVLSLVKQEAEEDECELSPLARLTEPQALAAVAAELKAEKIGVGAQESGLSPAASTAFSISWIARPRSRKSAKK